MGHGLGHREAPTAGPCGMGNGSTSMGAAGQGSWQHRMGTDLQAQTQVSLVPPTCRNSREERKAGFLLIALEGRLLVHSDFWEHGVQAQIRGSNYAEKKYTALKNNPPLERLQHCNKILMFKDIPS